MTLKPLIAGPDLLLVDGPGEETTLYDVSGRSLGSFTDTREAWAVIDEIDTGLRRAA